MTQLFYFSDPTQISSLASVPREACTKMFNTAVFIKSKSGEEIENKHVSVNQ